MLMLLAIQPARTLYFILANMIFVAHLHLPHQGCARRKNAFCVAQIRCGDLYSDKAVSTFTACAVSDKKCVPQKIDRDAFPEPKAESLDKNFDLSKFEVSLS